MSQKQLTRHVVIQKCLEDTIPVSEAAVALNLSNRQVIRLKKGVKINGPAALIHKNQSRLPQGLFLRQVSPRQLFV